MSRRRYCPVRKAHYNRKTRYRLTAEAYIKLLAKQKGKCAVCGRLCKLSVDHNHDTNKVRGLLCSNCNCLLGYALDSIATLRSAGRYLKRNQ